MVGEDDRVALTLPEQLTAGPITLHRRGLRDVPELRSAIRTSVDELRAFLRWAADGVQTTQDLEAAVAARDRDFEAGIGFEYVMREIASDELVGEAGGDVRDQGAVVEVGYWVRTDRVGRGYAAAAAAALTSVAFDASPDVARVELRMDKGNMRSRRVAERLGFALVGDEVFDGERLTGQTGQGWIWAIDRAAWARRS